MYVRIISPLILSYGQQQLFSKSHEVVYLLRALLQSTAHTSHSPSETTQHLGLANLLVFNLLQICFLMFLPTEEERSDHHHPAKSNKKP